MNAHGVAHRYGLAAEAALRAADHARAAGDARQEARASEGFISAALMGPTPVSEAVARCEELLASSTGNKRLEGRVLCLLAPLRAMQGDFDAARDAYARGRALLEEIGGKLIAASTIFNLSTVEMLAGNVAAAEQALRDEFDRLEEMGETFYRSTVAAHLAIALAAQERYDEAAHFTEVAEELATDDDVYSQALWRSARAKILANADQFDPAVELAREAVDLLATSDGLVKHASALLALAEVLARSGRTTDAAKVAEDALALFEKKGNRIAAKSTRDYLAALNGVSSA